MSANTLASIMESKRILTEAFSCFTPDETLICGSLNFIKPKFLELILKDINKSIHKKQIATEEDIKPAQEIEDDSSTAGELLDLIWNEFYHPVFKYYQSQLEALREKELVQKRKKVVEIRKMYAQFSKVSQMANNFYYDILKEILSQNKLQFIIPPYFYAFLEVHELPTAATIDTKDNNTIVKLVYLVHRCMLLIGSTARYTASLSHFLPQQSQKNYNSALIYIHNAELLLPAFGDARNLIGMIFNSQDDKLTAVYEFLRSSLSRIPSKLGYSNFSLIMNSPAQIIDKLNRARLETKDPKPKDYYSYISCHFLSLNGYYLFPALWSRADGVLINGIKVENVEKDLFRVIKSVAEQGDDTFIFEKLILLLIGAIKMKNANATTIVSIQLTQLLKFTYRYVVTLQTSFIELWGKDKTKSLKLLPFLRILYSWLKVDKLGLQFSKRNFEFLKNSALIANLIYKEKTDGSFDSRPEREQYFPEDIGIKEYTPLDRLLYDFNDSKIFKSDDSPVRLIGMHKSHDLDEENSLRLLSVGTIIKRILETNNVGIVFDKKDGSFNLENAKPIVKKKKEVTAPKIEGKLNSAPNSSSKKPKKKSRNRNWRKNKPNKPQSMTKSKTKPKKRAGPEEEEEDDASTDAASISSSDSDSDSESDVVEISQKTYHRGLENLATSNTTSNTTDIPLEAINAEDLEAKLSSTAKDPSLESMVDSLVDDNFKSISKELPTNTTWNGQPQPPVNMSPFSPQNGPFGYQGYYSMPGYPQFQQQIHSPTPNQSSQFSSHQPHTQAIYTQYQNVYGSPSPQQQYNQYQQYAQYQQTPLQHQKQHQHPHQHPFRSSTPNDNGPKPNYY